MTRLRLFGTTTSPYVRRVRIVADELGVPYELVNTATEDGQRALRASSPLWKVPSAELIADDGAVEPLFDSHPITEVLLHRHGPAPLTAFDFFDPTSRNVLSAIDGVVDALINVFVLARDGIKPPDAPYLKKQQDRAAASLAWLEQRAGELPTDFGLLPVALVTTIDWIRFRNTAPLDDYPALCAASDRWRDRPSVAQTMPG